MRNPYLVSLGLTSLQAINDGLVIIKHNPKLCFVSSFKWRKLKLENTNFIGENANQTTYCGMSKCELSPMSIKIQVCLICDN